MLSLGVSAQLLVVKSPGTSSEPDRIGREVSVCAEIDERMQRAKH